jgi:hypothetical protein
MKRCDNCKRLSKEVQRIVKDRKTKKRWFLKQCVYCKSNFSMEEYDGDIKSPEQEMDVYPWPPTKTEQWPKIDNRYWPNL